MSKKFQIAAASVLFAILVALALPAFLPPRRTTAANACQNNLRQLDGATQQWALEKGKTTNDVPTWEDLPPYLGPYGRLQPCDRGGSYTLRRLNHPPKCSYPGHSLR